MDFIAFTEEIFNWKLFAVVVTPNLSNVLYLITKSNHSFFRTFSIFRGGSRTAATSRMGHFVIIVNGWKPLTIIIKCSTLDVAAVLGPPLILTSFCWIKHEYIKLGFTTDNYSIDRPINFYSKRYVFVSVWFAFCHVFRMSITYKIVQNYFGLILC